MVVTHLDLNSLPCCHSVSYQPGHRTVAYRSLGGRVHDPHETKEDAWIHTEGVVDRDNAEDEEGAFLCLAHDACTYGVETVVVVGHAPLLHNHSVILASHRLVAVDRHSGNPGGSDQREEEEDTCDLVGIVSLCAVGVEEEHLGSHDFHERNAL